MKLAKYTALDPNQQYSVNPYSRGSAFGIQIPGVMLNDDLASEGGWADPMTIFDGGDKSWYQDPGKMFNVVHTVDDPDGAILHTDPFGPFNQPAHMLLQVIPGLIFGTTHFPSVNCSLAAGGCSLPGN